MLDCQFQWLTEIVGHSQNWMRGGGGVSRAVWLSDMQFWWSILTSLCFTGSVAGWLNRVWRPSPHTFLLLELILVTFLNRQSNNNGHIMQWLSRCVEVWKKAGFELLTSVSTMNASEKKLLKKVSSSHHYAHLYSLSTATMTRWMDGRGHSHITEIKSEGL